MTATDELRRKLTELHVEYETIDGHDICFTEWSTHNGAFVFTARESSRSYGDNMLRVETCGIPKSCMIATPEQAIDATLGPQIVRCKDCKHFMHNKEFWIEPPKVPFPMIGATSDCCDFWADTECKVEPDGFCAWGERKVVES